MANMKTATFYTAETGEVKEVAPKDGKVFTYEETSGFIGGLIQIVPLPDGREMVVHEEGKILGLPKNEPATKLWKEVYPLEKYPENNDELIVGNAIVGTYEIFNGEEQ